MADGREVLVHLTPQLAPPDKLAGGVAVVIDVMRATTTILHALAAGCSMVRPCAEVEEARELADSLRAGRVLLGGERGGKPLPGFEVGNSPREYTAARCRGAVLVLTTSNGSRALLYASAADRVLVAAFVNYSAVCEQLRRETRPIHIVCAGDGGAVALEDALLAGALVDFLSDLGSMKLNDGARLAWDAFAQHGRVLEGALAVGAGGRRLKELGYEDDIAAAACVDHFTLAPELRRDPLRIEVATAGIVKSHWRK